jgi:NAD(P)-dependent dehydrogenase (short-subunit alcohol dehydrogenase family)
VHPGNVRTPLWDRRAAEIALLRGVTVEKIVAEGRREVPMGDLTLPQDVAAAVAFLASSDSRHITGSQLIVDGGIVHCDSYHAMASSSWESGRHDDHSESSRGEPIWEPR